MYSAICNAFQVLFFLIWALSCKESDATGSYKNKRALPAAVEAAPVGDDATAGDDANDEAVPAGAAGSLAEQAQAILSKNCARCHGATNPQGNFAIIDNVPAMLASGRYIVAGNPEASLIFTKLAPFGNMPPVGPLASGDVSIIKQWIQSLQSNQVVALRDTQILDVIQKDIQSSVAAADQNQVRYFSLHVPNNVGVAEADLEIMRKAFFKVINSLSRSPVIVKPVPVDAKKLVYRLKLDEMGIPIAVFESVMADFYPGPSKPATSSRT
ncbi:MAG TPA: c-type cytochrome domain-containing protein [Oligoflexus sp.]|uniref:c-type cytochrome domain-containing protein n=1 Tax=Oligoflexus sp. TaxID=1971216 RepID=UPI002D6461B5|nr:c-type cytochrome domain-containing protein [Oligoflexus sp.]HYX36361.1 c-type cytochrome domain-containing protein [Oligoflexus sp.]